MTTDTLHQVWNDGYLESGGWGIQVPTALMRVSLFGLSHMQH
jgi:hypothetical protein